MGMTGAQLAEYGCTWIKGHRPQFRTLMHLIHREMERGSGYVQRGDVYRMARERGMAISEVRELRRDNSLWSVLARYMVMLSPVLVRALRFRRSVVDEVDLCEVWHRVVGTYPLWYARSWQEAERLAEMGDVTALTAEEVRHGI